MVAQSFSDASASAERVESDSPQLTRSRKNLRQLSGDVSQGRNERQEARSAGTNGAKALQHQLERQGGWPSEPGSHLATWAERARKARSTNPRT